MQKNWMKVWLLSVVFLAGCTRCDRSAPSTDLQPQTNTPKDNATAPSSTQPTTQEAPDKAATASNQPQDENLYQQLKKQGTISPGSSVDLARIPEPTQKELADPKMQHLNEATKRTLVIFRKLQQKVPQLTQGTDGSPDPVINEAEFSKKWKKKAKQFNKKQKRSRKSKKRSANR